jgi:Domain of unknown function (DUF4440)
MKKILLAFLLLSARVASAQSSGDTTSLRQSVTTFMDASDHGDVSTISSLYDSSFENVRVTDQGNMITLSRVQILQFLQSAGRPSYPTQSTTIHRVEVTGTLGFVLISRVKDLGNGWEPMFYTLVWTYSNGKWLLLREFVHQKSLPAKK